MVGNVVAGWVVNDSTCVRVEISSINADSYGLLGDCCFEESTVVLGNIHVGVDLDTGVIFRVVIARGLKGLVLPVITQDQIVFGVIEPGETSVIVTSIASSAARTIFSSVSEVGHVLNTVNELKLCEIEKLFSCDRMRSFKDSNSRECPA